MQEIDMPLLQVRDCPDDIYKKIALVAKKQNRTIAQQIVVLLEKSLGQEQSNIERRKQVIEKIKSRNIPNDVKIIDAVALIREDRDR
jgi:predicted nuclease of restriction endonuclease-like RecB superfamily